MKRIVLALAMLGTFGTSLQTARADDWYYAGGPYGQPYYGAQYQQQGNPILKKVLIGGALIGAGFLAGRLTAPRPYAYGYAPAPIYQHHHGYPTPYGYRY